MRNKLRTDNDIEDDTLGHGGKRPGCQDEKLICRDAILVMILEADLTRNLALVTIPILELKMTFHIYPRPRPILLLHHKVESRHDFTTSIEMPEVIRGSRSHENAITRSDSGLTLSPTLSPTAQPARSPLSPQSPGEGAIDFGRTNSKNNEQPDHITRPSLQLGRTSSSWRRSRRQSIQRAEADVYYDSRAATKREFRRRGTTLQDYYKENPKLLPQLPFTWHHGWRRYRFGLLIFLIFIDACIVPIALYYAMAYAGNVQGWIIFAVVTTIWGGPTYLEFGIRTWRLAKKERFYRPLGTNSRWCFDLTNWTSVLIIASITTLFVVGSAPHIVFLRVLSMPGPALLYSLGIVLDFVTLYNICGWKAPFRLSSTSKGEPVKPVVYYFIEDVISVNAGAGRPYREALAARYDASPRFRRMLYIQSLFWSIPPIIIAIPLTVIACVHTIPATVAYGICKLIRISPHDHANNFQAGLYHSSGLRYGVLSAFSGVSETL